MWKTQKAKTTNDQKPSQNTHSGHVHEEMSCIKDSLTDRYFFRFFKNGHRQVTGCTVAAGLTKYAQDVHGPAAPSAKHKPTSFVLRVDLKFSPQAKIIFENQKAARANAQSFSGRFHSFLARLNAASSVFIAQSRAVALSKSWFFK